MYESSNARRVRLHVFEFDNQCVISVVYCSFQLIAPFGFVFLIKRYFIFVGVMRVFSQFNRVKQLPFSEPIQFGHFINVGSGCELTTEVFALFMSPLCRP